MFKALLFSSGAIPAFGKLGTGVGVEVTTGVGVGVGVGVNTGVGVVIGVGVGTGVGVGVTGTEHAVVMVFLSVVIIPSNNDKALPVQTVLAPTEIALLLSIMVPINVVLALRVVAAVGVQNTLQDDAPSANLTTEPAAEVSAPTALKIYVPAPLRVIPAVPILIAPVLQYTPGVYTPVGCVPTVERLTITPKFSVHGSRFRAVKASLASVFA